MLTKTICHHLSLGSHPSMERQKNASGSIENASVTGCHSFSLERMKSIIKERNSICNIYIENNRKNGVTSSDSSDTSPEVFSDYSQPKLTPQQTEQLFDNPLRHLFWWDLLMSIWSMAQQYNFEWADAFLPHIVNLDTDWLTRAMVQTFQKLNTAHQQLLCEEYDGFIALDKICDWKLMCRGHEYIAVLCTRYFPDIRLKRSVYAWSLAEAKAKYTPTPASVETLLGWMRPWDSDERMEKVADAE